MHLPLLLMVARASASPCAVDALDTRIRWQNRDDRRGLRVDRWTLYAEDLAPDCRRVHIPDLRGAELISVRAKVKRPDERPFRLGEERLHPGGIDDAAGWTLHLPELRAGSRLELRVERRLTTPTTSWAPGLRGPLPWARLRAKKTEQVQAELHGHDAPPMLKPDRPGTWIRVEEPALGDPGSLVVHLAAPGAQPHTAPVLRSSPDGPVHPADFARTRIELLPDPSGDRLPQEPPAGATRWQQQLGWDRSAPPMDVAWPAGIDDGVCEAMVGGQPRPAIATKTGWGCRFRPPPQAQQPVELRWSWTEPRLAVVGEQRLNPTTARQLEVALVAPAALDLSAWSAGAPLDDQTVDGQRIRRIRSTPGAADIPSPSEEPRLAWRLRATPSGPVLPDRDAVLSQVAYAAIAASMPEPGLPVRFKNRKKDPELVPDVLDLVRKRLHPSRLPDRGPLSPRKLVDVLRSGWGTPWEQALLLTRYLRQLKLDALPVPVRPRSAGRIDPATPVGYSDAVVRVDMDGQTLWIDPSCGVCTIGELPGELWGGQALAEGVETLPQPPVGRIEVELRPGADDEPSPPTATLHLEGPAALELRRALRPIPPAERARAVGGLVGLSGAQLVEHHGLAELGAPIRLRMRLPQEPPMGPSLAQLAGASTPRQLHQVVQLPTTQDARPTGPRRIELAGAAEQPLATWIGQVQQQDGHVQLVEDLELHAAPLSLHHRQQLGDAIGQARDALLHPPEPADATPADDIQPDAPPDPR